MTLQFKATRVTPYMVFTLQFRDFVIMLASPYWGACWSRRYGFSRYRFNHKGWF